MKIDRVAVGREARLGGVAVKGLSKDAGLAAGGWRDGDVVRGVLEEMGIELGDVGDELAVGDQEGVSSSPGLVVTWVSWAPLSVLLAATTQMSVL